MFRIPNNKAFQTIKPLITITMKKLFYILSFLIISSITITACSEEEIVPTSEFNGGGHPSDPK